MGFFSRRDKIVDLTDEFRYTKRMQPKEVLGTPSPGNASSQNKESSLGGFFNFFGNSNVSSSASSSSESTSSENSSSNESLDANEKRRRLARRLKDMTDRIEDLSNQIYILQQRIEVLERKNKPKREE